MTAAGIGWRITQIGLGLLALVLGARWLVEAGSGIARALGVSELIIGLTIVAIGTSLPEIATSVLASMRGERDMAVGNAVGSNIFNILTVLGLSAAVAPGGLPLSNQLLQFDVPIMVATALATLPIFALGHKLARWQGVLFLLYFAAYIGALCLRANNGAPGQAWDSLALALVAPLVLVTLTVQVYRVNKRWAAGAGTAEELAKPRSIKIRAADYEKKTRTT
jgi:cation:H+ antiporter